jgi:type IV pilus assembly protein PilO
MPNLTQTRKRMKAAIIGLAIVDVVTIAFLFSPLTARPQIRENLLVQAKNDLQLKTKEVEPMMGMDEKLKNAEKDLSKFYENRLPERNSAIYAEFGKLAQQNNIRIAQALYPEKESDLPELRQVEIDASLEGEYVNLVKFINGLERDKMFFIVESVNLDGEQGGGVKLALKARTFLKN